MPTAKGKGIKGGGKANTILGAKQIALRTVCLLGHLLYNPT